MRLAEWSEVRVVSCFVCCWVRTGLDGFFDFSVRPLPAPSLRMIRRQD